MSTLRPRQPDARARPCSPSAWWPSASSAWARSPSRSTRYGPVTDNAQSVYELSTIEQLPGIEAEIKRDFGFTPHFEQAKEHLEENDGAGNTFKATAKPVLIGTAVVGATTMIFSIIVALTHGLQPETAVESLDPAPAVPARPHHRRRGDLLVHRRLHPGRHHRRLPGGGVHQGQHQARGHAPRRRCADSKKVVEICTQYAQKGMFNIFLAVFFATLAFAFVEPYFFIGYLISIALFGLYQAIFMANAGGAWDNAKKIVETELKTKGTAAARRHRRRRHRGRSVQGHLVGGAEPDHQVHHPVRPAGGGAGRFADQRAGRGLYSRPRGALPRGRAGLRLPVLLRDADRGARNRRRGSAGGGEGQGS